MKKWLKEKYGIIIFLSLIFFIMLILNSLTPLISDDFGYSFNLSYERLTGLRDIINYQIVHYNLWGGRTVAHVLVQLFLLGPKVIFNIFNSLCFTTLIYLIYLIIKREKENALMIPIIFFLVYFLQPVFGQCCLWLTGSCNYLWTTTIVLLMLHLFIKKTNTKDSLIHIILAFILGIIAGWTNENTSFSLIIVLLLLLINTKREKLKVKKWQIFGIIGNVIGFIIMILAPGNYVRKEGFAEGTSILKNLLTRFIECTKGIFTYELIILIIFAVLIGILICSKKKINKNSIIFMVGSIMGVYPMILSPTFPERSWFAVIIFGIISIMILLNDIEFIKHHNYIILSIFIVLMIIFIPNYIDLTKDIKKLKNVWDNRIEYFKNNPNEEEYALEVYSTNNKRNPIYKQLDILNDPTAWPNKDISNYFNVKNIIIKQ